MEAGTLFQEQNVILNLKAQSREEILTALYEKLYESGKVKASFLENVIEREKKFPTGLKVKGFDIAIPHTESEHVKESAIAVAKVQDDVAFERMDDPDETVNPKIIFMLALNNGHDHMEMISQIVRMFQKKDVLDNLYRADSAQKVISIIQNNL